MAGVVEAGLESSDVCLYGVECGQSKEAEQLSNPCADAVFTGDLGVVHLKRTDKKHGIDQKQKMDQKQKKNKKHEIAKQKRASGISKDQQVTGTKRDTKEGKDMSHALLRVLGGVNGFDVNILIDGGASHDFMSASFYRKLDVRARDVGKMELRLGNGESMAQNMQVTDR